MLKLYGTLRSRAFRCLWMLEESGVEYERVEVDFAKGDTRKPEFLAINANGKVPVLVDGERVLVESLSINLYLAQHYASALWPGDDRLTEVIQWTTWAMGELEGPHDAANRTQSAVDDTRLASSLEFLAAALADQPYLLGELFSVVDLNLAAVLLRPQFRPHGLEHPIISPWFRRCIERPALKGLRAPEDARKD